MFTMSVYTQVKTPGHNDWNSDEYFYSFGLFILRLFKKIKTNNIIQA